MVGLLKHEMQKNLNLKENPGACPSAFPGLEVVFPGSLLVWMAFSLSPGKCTRQKQRSQACERMGILTRVPALQVYEMRLIGLKSTFM